MKLAYRLALLVAELRPGWRARLTNWLIASGDREDWRRPVMR